MSVLNLVATCLTAEYPLLYMVRTAIMEEAEADGGKFSGAIADLDLDTINIASHPIYRMSLNAILGFLLSLVPLTIAGVVSRFQAGSSSTLQRVVMMAWLVFGTLGGVWFSSFLYGFQDAYDELNTFPSIVDIRPILEFFIKGGVLALGGFVLVGKMINEYGACIYLD
ncbi:uncharacterized protein BJX67DRAFT_385557 [Aspergillus lucknowensis]|uniref:Uncharacterized protein n=1 Tax=Aspergillus lucknowensis TaxID=176173 RepID=A0ABR4LDC3_9EURO